MAKKQNKSMYISNQDKIKMVDSFVEIAKDINASDKELTKEVFTTLKKERKSIEPAEEYINITNKVLADYEKVLEEDISLEEKKEILESEKEIYKLADEKERKRLEINREITKDALEKDSEAREFNWNKIKAASFTIVAIVAGIGIGIATKGKTNLLNKKK